MRSGINLFLTVNPLRHKQILFNETLLGLYLRMKFDYNDCKKHCFVYKKYKRISHGDVLNISSFLTLAC